MDKKRSIDLVPKGSWINSQSSFKIKDGELLADLYDCNGNIHSRSIKINYDFLYNNKNGNFDIEAYNNTLFIIIGNQLGNCLRVITSCIIIAEYYKMNVFIDIDKCVLYNKDKQIIKLLFPHLYKTNVSFPYSLLKYNEYVEYENMYSTNYNLICEGKFHKLPYMNSFSINSNIYSIIPGNMDNDTYIKKKIKIYQSLPWPDFLLKEIETFISKFNLSTYIGFHLRFTDNMSDLSKKNFNTPIQVFIDKLTSYSNTNIFICSDNQELIYHFKNKKEKKNNLIFPDLCSYPNFQHLYEMLLLSKTKLIIGSTSSTFSYESAFIEGTNIELYEEGKWNLYELSKYKQS